MGLLQWSAAVDRPEPGAVRADRDDFWRQRHTELRAAELDLAPAGPFRAGSGPVELRARPEWRRDERHPDANDDAVAFACLECREGERDAEHDPVELAARATDRRNYARVLRERHRTDAGDARGRCGAEQRHGPGSQQHDAVTLRLIGYRPRGAVPVAELNWESEMAEPFIGQISCFG